MFSGTTAGGLLQTLATKAKALAAGVTEIELKVLEATNEDKWGPHGNAMKEIARAANDSEQRALIMGVIWQRLQEREENWRLCYKALLLCEFLIKQGPMRCVDELQRSVYVFERLRDNFHYKDDKGVDQGINVRQRARELASLLSSNQKVQEERDKAQRNANKYTGVSAADMARGGYGGGYGSSGYGSGGGGGGYSGYGSSGYEGGRYDSPDNRSGHGGKSDYSDASRINNSSSDKPTQSSSATEEDPFEATRKRIERLKAQGGGNTESSGGGPGHIPAGSINMDASPNLFPESKPRPGPKKLSEVKVDPNIAAAFGGGGGGLKPPPSAAAGTKAAPTITSTATQQQHTASRAAAPAVAALDLLDMSGTTTAPAPAASKTNTTAAADNLDWDSLDFQGPASAKQPAPASNQSVDLLAFPSPAPAASNGHKPAAAPLDLLGFDAPVQSAPKPAAAAAPPSDAFGGFADPFSSLATPQTAAVKTAATAVPVQQPPSSNTAAFDPFAASTAPTVKPVTPPSNDDPFSAFVGAPAPAGNASNVAMNGQMLKPHKPKDPFADLFG